jgi:hypothetical protein
MVLQLHQRRDRTPGRFEHVACFLDVDSEAMPRPVRHGRMIDRALQTIPKAADLRQHDVGVDRRDVAFGTPEMVDVAHTLLWPQTSDDLVASLAQTTFDDVAVTPKPDGIFEGDVAFPLFAQHSGQTLEVVPRQADRAAPSRRRDEPEIGAQPARQHAKIVDMVRRRMVCGLPDELTKLADRAVQCTRQIDRSIAAMHGSLSGLVWAPGLFRACAEDERGRPKDEPHGRRRIPRRRAPGTLAVTAKTADDRTREAGGP